MGSSERVLARGNAGIEERRRRSLRSILPPRLRDRAGFGPGRGAGSHAVCIPTAAIIDFSGGKLTVTGPTATANIFATYLPDHMTLWRGFLDEVSGPGAGGPPPPQKGPAGSPLWWSGQGPWMGQYAVTALPGVGAGGAAEALGRGRGPGAATVPLPRWR